MSQNYSALRAAFGLCYGIPKLRRGPNHTWHRAGPQQVSLVAKFIRFLRNAMNSTSWISNWCLGVRRDCLEDNIYPAWPLSWRPCQGDFAASCWEPPPTVSAKKLFMASRVRRALILPISDQEVKDAIAEKERIWTTPHEPVPQVILESLTEFARDAARAALDAEHPLQLRQRCYPLPSSHVCLESGAETGGTRAALLYSFDHWQAQRFQQGLLPQPGIPPHTFAPVVTDSINMMPHMVGTPKQLTEHAYDVLLDDIGQPLMEPVGLKERGGKVRVATLHPASAAQVSRHLAAQLLPVLRHLGVHRASLRGEEVKLFQESKEETKLVSADLKAATDPMPFSVQHALLEGLAGPLQWSPKELAAAKILSGPQILDDDRDTLRGGYLGLGISWTLMSLCNSWAAHSSGAPFSSYRCNGDDLIGLWTVNQLNGYMSALEDIHLIPNRKKTHVADRRGVFCEAIVLRSKRCPSRAYSESVASIAALSGSSQRYTTGKACGGDYIRWLAAQRNDPLLPRVLRQLASTTLSRFQVPTGSLAKPSAALVKGLLLKGLVAETRKDVLLRNSPVFNHAVQEARLTSGSVRIRDALTEHAVALNRKAAMQRAADASSELLFTSLSVASRRRQWRSRALIGAQTQLTALECLQSAVDRNLMTGTKARRLRPLLRRMDQASKGKCRVRRSLFAYLVRQIVKPSDATTTPDKADGLATFALEEHFTCPERLDGTKRPLPWAEKQEIGRAHV